MMYMFFQQEEKSSWHPALASERDNLIRTKKPALVSVLNVDHSFDTDLTLEEVRALRYEGPFYVDFDAADIDEATEQFKLFLVNLKAVGVNLGGLRLFCTGKKGYHIEFPAGMFMGKVPPTGTQGLPHIYKEMAKALYVDTLDMRVYSTKRGRMWRCPSVKRTDNGAYKVQISAEEALSIDAEIYAQLCSSPRNTLPTEPPSLNPELALLYAQSRDKVVKAVAKQKLKKHSDGQLLKFKGEWPETFEGILAGVTIKEGVGWNHLSMQLAIVASELGRTEDQLIADAEGLILSHESDSSRYDTPAKRRRDLRDMFRYVAGNPCYEFSIGAIMALLIPEARANADISFGEYVPEKPPAKEATGGATTEEETEDEDTGSVRVNSRGIFVRGDEGFRCVCDVGMQKPITMFGTDGDQIGYEVEVTLDGKKRGRKFLPMNALATRGQFNGWTLTMGASMRGSDMHTSNLADIFRQRSVKSVYAVEREGVDIVSPKGADTTDVIWASPDGVICNNDTVSYRHHGVFKDSGTYNSDLMKAPALCVEDGDYITDLLSINTSANLAKLIGWFSAAFLTQLIRKEFRRFPSLQVFGQAGAGKSMTIILLNHMHYYKATPRQFSVAGQTQFPLIAAVATSASMPLVFEEVKTRQLTKHLKDFLQGLLRSNYTADSYARGSLGRDKSVRELTVSEYGNGAPVVFIGEAIEDQSAILERCVVVALSKTDRSGRSEHFDACLRDATHMGHLGKALAESALAIDRDLLRDTVTRNFKEVSGHLSASTSDDATRPAFNLAVTLTGLDFLKSVLSGVFDDRFDERIDELREAILGNVMDSIPKNMSEASRVMDTLAQLSRNPDQTLQLVEGVDYMVNPDGTLDLKVRTAYDKYVRYQRSLGMEVLFDTHQTFTTSLSNYGGTVQRACPGSPLFDSVKAVVFKLSLAYLDKEGVDSFETVTKQGVKRK